MTETVIHLHLTPALLREALQGAGYRVEEAKDIDGAPLLRSATGGLAFTMMFFNPRPDQADDTPPGAARFADATFQAVFQVEGDLPLPLVNQWNATRRFARLHLLPGLLMLNMDIIALGGVTSDHLRAQAGIWDQLVQHLIAFLREELPKLAKASPVVEPVPEQQAPSASDAA
ncbi:YbjN domain-containing protein [Magnetospirillum fulvum]|uniref:Putative sensory transduction regulator n=1 Tax=Magnetospirillum fulvum TaxID=1082 RepID=A0A1H6HG56_MAGFU|nr:YbjN domain-containing protein [Magnetospirillum fulvum]SEH32923.1 Putative sensory transduction regulator [Magnetospirillum fulvum]